MHTAKITQYGLAIAVGFAVLAIPAFWPPIASDGMTLGIAVLLGLALSLLSAIDLDTLRLPDALTLPLVALGLAVCYVNDPDSLLWNLAAALSAGLLLFLIAQAFRRARGVDALGLGDAKLFAAAGAWVGFEGLPGVLLLSSLSALIVAAIGMLSGAKIDRATRIPFGPFLAGALWLTWLYGPHILL